MNQEIINAGADKCPQCGYHIDDHFSLDPDAIPSKDDLSVCMKCGEWNKFDENLKLVLLTTEERAGMEPSLLFELQQISTSVLQSKRADNEW